MTMAWSPADERLGRRIGVDREPHDLPGAGELLAAAAGFPVDADADLHLVLGKVEPGLPAAGVVHAVRATAKDAESSLTRRPMAATASSAWPSAAAAPATFSTISVAPVPRRPAVQVEFSTATSSSTSTVSTRMPVVAGELGGHLEVHARRRCSS